MTGLDQWLMSGAVVVGVVGAMLLFRWLTRNGDA